MKATWWRRSSSRASEAPPSATTSTTARREAIGTATDLWEAYEKGAFGVEHPRPWLGWVLLLEDCKGSTGTVGVDEPHFPVFPEFKGSSYAKRYELILRKLVLKKLFDGSSLLMSTAKAGPRGGYAEPAVDLSMKKFLAGLAGHVRTYKASL